MKANLEANGAAVCCCKGGCCSSQIWRCMRVVSWRKQHPNKVVLMFSACCMYGGCCWCCWCATMVILLLMCNKCCWWCLFLRLNNDAVGAAEWWCCWCNWLMMLLVQLCGSYWWWCAAACVQLMCDNVSISHICPSNPKLVEGWDLEKEKREWKIMMKERLKKEKEQSQEDGMKVKKKYFYFYFWFEKWPTEKRIWPIEKVSQKKKKRIEWCGDRKKISNLAKKKVR